MHKLRMTNKEREAYKAFRSHLTEELKSTHHDYTIQVLGGRRSFVTAKDVLFHTQTIQMAQETKPIVVRTKPVLSYSFDDEQYHVSIQGDHNVQFIKSNPNGSITHTIATRDLWTLLDAMPNTAILHTEYKSQSCD